MRPLGANQAELPVSRAPGFARFGERQLRAFDIWVLAQTLERTPVAAGKCVTSIRLTSALRIDSLAIFKRITGAEYDEIRFV
jgi:hypothetical protein